MRVASAACLVRTARAEAGADRAARRRAEKTLTGLLAEVDKQRAPTSTVTLADVLDEWLRSVELEDTTRRTYVGYIDRTLAPALGLVAADKLSTLTLERRDFGHRRRR